MAKYYYNGVLLPEIPVIEGYPNVWIRKNVSTGYYDAVYTASDILWYYSNGMYPTNESVTIKWYRLAISDGTEWVYNRDTTGYFSIDTSKIVFWSCIDIPNGFIGATDIYFYGSEPYRVLYLVKADGKLYTVVDDALSELTATDIVAQTFLDYGIEDIPDGALLVGLSNPEVLCWQDREDDLPTLIATVTATPHPQTVISSRCDLSDATITGIESMLATCEGELICAVSFDDKATWKAHNGAEWVTLSDEYVGMSKETLEAITLEQWNELYSDASGLYIRFALNDTTQSVAKIEIDFSN